jgi:plastocyanin
MERKSVMACCIANKHIGCFTTRYLMHDRGRLMHIFGLWLRSVRRPASWAVFASLLIVVFGLAACGADNTSTSSTTSSTSSTPSKSSNATSAATVAVRESRIQGQPDVYRCDPNALTLKKGDSVTFTNMTDEIQDFDQGDVQQAGIDLRLPLSQSATVTFHTPGTFTITSEKGATITVTVQ